MVRNWTSRNRPRWAALAAAALLAGAALPVSATIYDAFAGSGPQGDLIYASGTLTIDTGTISPSSNPTLSDGAALNITGDIVDDVAVFRFVNVSVTGSTVVNTSGQRALAIVSANDAVWSAAINASGSSGAKLGGGAGGQAGAGGTGGANGGSGGSGAGLGGIPLDGTTGCSPGDSCGRGGLRDGNSNADGEPGPPRVNGGAGNSGGSGGSGGPGGSGGAGAEGTGLSGSFVGDGGTGGSGGTGGGYLGNFSNGGGGTLVAGGGGAGGSSVGNTGGNPNAGNATQGGVQGGAGSVGRSGEDADPGNPGGNGQFLTPANTLAFAGGAGGGGGGGGGRAGSGQGGGQGGGGSSGAGGGGGGAVIAANVCSGAPSGANPPSPTNGQGGSGALGGNGGNGRAGGNGGTAPNGASGGTGGNGGGAVLLSARGLLHLQSSVDISAGPRIAAGASPGFTPGSPGTVTGNNGSPPTGVRNAPTDAIWSSGPSGSCSPATRTAGAGGAGSAGGAGGNGGTGGASGVSGAGGTAGFGTPGMLKLQGSVIQANAGSVLANNTGGSADAARNGKLTLISNMTAAAVSANSPGVTTDGALVSGSIAHNPILRAPNPYLTPPGTISPLMPQLAGGVATHGLFNTPSYFNASTVSAATPAQTLPEANVDLIVLEGADSVFQGFDHVVVRNNTADAKPNMFININASGWQSIGTLPANGVWTTTAPDSVASYQIAQSIQIGAHPQDAADWAQNGASFSVGLDSGDPVQYQWQFAANIAGPYNNLPNGGAISGANDATLNISSASPAMEGFFRVRMLGPVSGTNPATDGIFSDPAQLTLFQNGTFTEHPQDQQSIDGSMLPVQFTGAFAGDGIIAYQWQFSDDGGGMYVNLNDGDRGGRVVAVDNTLTINGPFVPSDLGLYRLRVTNDNPSPFSADSDSASLTFADPLITQHPADASVLSGATASFTASAAGGVNDPSYQWQKFLGGVWTNLSDGPTGSGATYAGTFALPPAASSTLQIINAQAADSGLFRLVAANSGPDSPAISNDAELSVLAAPVITQEPQDTVVPEGGSAQLTVVADGTPVLAYAWEFSSAPGGPYAGLVEGVDGWTGVDTDTLSLSGADTNVNEGYVRVRVSNVTPVIAISSPAFVLVGDPLTITQHPADVDEYVTGAPFSLTAAAAGGKGPQVIEWFKDNVPVPNSNSPALLVEPAAVGVGSHTYHAVFTDDRNLPLSTDDAVVTIAAHLSEPVIGPSPGQAAVGQQFTFTAAVTGGLGALSYQWFRDDGSKALQPIPGAESNELTFDPVFQGHAGFYAVTVSDSGTDSETSDLVELIVVASVPAAGPLGLLALAGILGGAILIRRRKR